MRGGERMRNRERGKAISRATPASANVLQDQATNSGTPTPSIERSANARRTTRLHRTSYHAPVRSRLQPLIADKPPFTLATYKLLLFSKLAKPTHLKSDKATTKATDTFKVVSQATNPSFKDEVKDDKLAMSACTRSFKDALMNTALDANSKSRSISSPHPKQKPVNGSQSNLMNPVIISKPKDWFLVLPKTLKNNLPMLRACNRLQFINRKLASLKRLGRCFRCQCKGHLASSCKRKATCLACGQIGHSIGKCSYLSNLYESTAKGNHHAVNTASAPPDVQRVATHALTNNPLEMQPEPSINTEPPPTKSHNLQITLSTTPTLQTTDMAFHMPIPPPVLLPEDWQNMPMESAAAFFPHRPHRLQVYFPDMEQLDRENSLLMRSAILSFQAGFPQRNFANRVRLALSQAYGGHVRDYSVRPIGDNADGDFLLICSSVAIRNQVTADGGLLVLEPDTVLQFRNWRRSHDAMVEPPSFWTRVRISNVPLHLYNKRGIEFLTSGFGTPIRVAPHFTVGNFGSLHILVKGGHPAYIPRFVTVSTDPYAKLAEVTIEGYAQVWPYDEDPPYYGPGMPWEPEEQQQPTENASSNHPTSGVDCNSQPPVDTYTGEESSHQYRQLRNVANIKVRPSLLN